MTVYTIRYVPLPAKLATWKFQPFEVVSRRSDPQLQVSENYADILWNGGQTYLNLVFEMLIKM